MELPFDKWEKEIAASDKLQEEVGQNLKVVEPKLQAIFNQTPQPQAIAQSAVITCLHCGSVMSMTVFNQILPKEIYCQICGLVFKLS